MGALKWLNQLPMATWRQHEPAAWTVMPSILGVLCLLLPCGFPICWPGFLPIVLIISVRPELWDMKVTVLDVGQGLSVEVLTVKHNLVYDAVPKYNAQSYAGGPIICATFAWRRYKKVDGFNVSYNDIEHSGSMASVFVLMPVACLPC
jgi:competence protein ComEC